ncbi:unnamed protein product [Rotaria sordida]|uniref:NAD-dependent epimerase/dehydratase domain-containing protein n=1 Tax=Rotaria sordida TaxID=392033 RepID=A0A814FCW5_9BILA|nr:unnamed protein product [Rotaria sordida]
MPDDYIELKNKATIGFKTLKRVNGTLYKIESAANLLYESAGGSNDWTESINQIKYVYTVELRPPDDMNDAHAHFTFILPLTFIERVEQETYAGLIGRILFNYLTTKYQVFGLDQHTNISPKYQLEYRDPIKAKPILPLSLDKFFQYDITDRIKLHKIIQEQKIETIIHLEAIGETDPDIEKISRVNIEGTKNVFEAPGVRHIIYASSVITVFGYLTREPYLSILNGTFDDTTMLKDLRKLTIADDPPIPDLQTPGNIAYSQSKIIGKQMATDIVKNSSKSIICARFGWINV